MPSSVRPWNAWSNATTAERPVALRAIFTAFSTASAPEFANIVFAATVDRRERVQPLGELDVRLVRGHVEARVRVEFRLTLDGRDHLGRGVADVQHGDAGREVDQPVAVDVFDDRARGPGGDDRVEVGNPGRDRGRASREPLSALRPRDLGDELAFLWDVHARKCDGSASEARQCARLSRPGPVAICTGCRIRLSGTRRGGLRCAVRTFVSSWRVTVTRHRLDPRAAPAAPCGGRGARPAGPLGPQLGARGPDRRGSRAAS